MDNNKQDIKDRIVEFIRVPASSLVPHPSNWRKHPKRQQDLLRSTLEQIGYADASVARRLPDGTLQLLDGHLRKDTTPRQDVPVLVVDLDDQEAALFLATHDPLSTLAETDSALLASLVGEAAIGGELGEWLNTMADVFVVNEAELPSLKTGDKEPFQSMTFTVSDRQAEIIKRAIAQAKGGDYTSSDNANSNGNALAAIAEAYLG